MGTVRRLALATLLGLGFASASFAQRTGFNEREIEPQLTANDKEDVWTLHFRFQDPRIIVEKVPGRGTKIVWYMIYRVYNLDPREEPHVLVPDIDLVTLDRHTRHTDEVLPSVEEAIRKREDPTGRFGIKNSVTISEAAVPVSKKDAFPRAITGVAIWTDVDPVAKATDKTPKTNKFSIFIAGLSNGFTEERPADQPGVRIIKRKTLQLDFERLGDGEQTEPSGIRWTGSSSWIYRASTEPLQGAGDPKDAPAPKKDEPKKDDAKKEEARLNPRLPGNNLSAPILEPIPALPVRREKPLK